MIKELYIDGYLVDIDDNFSIVRQLTSPFFSDVTQLKNNGSYSTKIPETQNNSFIMDYLEREDADTTFPYRGHEANYYVDSFPVFENAEVRVIDAFELQFVWGLNRGKYLPLFTRKLNEIVPNGTTILESDWVVPWKKGNGVDTGMFTPGKKYKYLNYISGERESEVKIIDGEVQPLTEAPDPFLSNLKEMTMHPFVKFTDILDLIIADTNMESFEFDDLKARLTNKGLILGGNKCDKSIEYTRTYASETEFDDQVFQVEGGGARYYLLPLTYFSSSFAANSLLDLFYWSDYVLSNNNDELEVHINLTTLSNYIRGLSLYSLRSVPGTLYNEINEIQELEFTYIDPPGGYNFKRTYDTIIHIKKERGVLYFIGGAGGFSDTVFVKAGGELKITHTTKHSMYSMIASPTIDPAHYNCLMNLPDMTAAEFINQMLIMTGLFVGHDANGNMKFLSLDKLKANLLSGNIYDWSGKVSQREKSYFQFNSNAQKNWIKFANSDDRTYPAKDSIVVDDTTLDTEKDLYTISFDLAEQEASGIAEFILYKQKVASSGEGATEVKTFSNEYSSKNDVCVYDNNGIAKNANILPNSSVNPTFFSMVLTRTGKYTFTFVTPTSGLPIPEIGNKVYSPNPFGSGYVFRGVVTNKVGNTLTVSFPTFLGTTITFWFDNSATGFVAAYYDVYKKIVYRPRVLDIVVKLDFLETLNIDFEKPVYISDYGKYAVLLDIKIPDDGLCNAKILLINQTL